MRRCPKCLAPARSSDRFCSLCQCALPADDATPEAPAEAVPSAPSEGVFTPPPARSGQDELLDAGRRAFGGEPTLHTHGLKRLAGVAAWTLAEPRPHVVLVTLGLSELGQALYRYELSGRGFELVCRVEGTSVPPWLLEVLDDAAAAAPGELPSTPRRAKLEGLSGARLAEDAALPTLETDNGRVHFVSVAPKDGDFFHDVSDAEPAPFGAPAWASLLALGARHVRPAVAFAREDGPGGRSHAGGDALVPADFAWPRRNDVPLPLLLQLDLADVAAALAGLVPVQGRLLLFGPPDDLAPQYAGLTKGRTSWNELYQVRLVTDAGSPRSEGVRLPECGLRFEAFSDFPDWRELAAMPEVKGLRGDARERAVEAYAHRRPRAPFPHQLFGACHSIQDDAVLDAVLEAAGVRPPVPRAKLAAFEAEAAQHVALLQLEAEGDWRFASDGRLFVVVPRAALAAGDLSAARIILQR